MIYYLLGKHTFLVVSHIHLSKLHVYCVIPLHESVSFVSFASGVVVDDVGDIGGFIVIPPKKYHALKRIIAAGINILNTILFTILYWKLRVDDIFTILLYIIPNILFS